VLGEPRRADDGGVVEHAGAGGDVRLALLPFCSKRSIVRSEQLMGLDAGQLGGVYDERVRHVIAHLTEGFTPDAVNVIALHGMVTGAQLGGGERAAQTFDDYCIGSVAFPAHAHYVAVGHVHRTQQIGGAAPIWYSGSPLQVDFGDTEPEANVLIVEAATSTPAQIRKVPVTGARRLQTLRGGMDQLRELAGTTGDDFLRVIVEEPGRAGLAEEVRELLGEGVLDVHLPPRERQEGGERRSERGLSRTPHELFAEYLRYDGTEDPRLNDLFAELLELETT
jgi:exonuclease SbcD